MRPTGRWHRSSGASISSAEALLVKLETRLDEAVSWEQKRLLGLKLTKRAVANQMGVAETSVFNWGANTSDPELRYMPAIIGFLGYNPLPKASGWGEWLARHRTSLGMTQEEAAKRLGVDAGTLARWEQGERKPDGVLAARAGRFLETEEAAQVPDVKTA